VARRTVDLNADVGEGFDADGELFGIVTSANVACGFHAGDADTMRAACEAAVGVAIGAHVSYRDREGFGRRVLAVDAVTIGAETAEQIALLQEISGGRVAYVKPHGALYHRASREDECAAAIVARGEPGAVLDANAAALQAVALASRVGSLCVHSDTPGAAAVARRVRGALEAAGVELRAFA